MFTKITAGVDLVTNFAFRTAKKAVLIGVLALLTVCTIIITSVAAIVAIVS